LGVEGEGNGFDAIDEPSEVGVVQRVVGIERSRVALEQLLRCLHPSQPDWWGKVRVRVRADACV
jgi:hypothetical protein